MNTARSSLHLLCTSPAQANASDKKVKAVGLLCIVPGVNLEARGVRCMPWQGEPVAILARFAWKMSCWHENYHSTPPPSPFIGRLSPWKSTSNHGLVPINSEVQTNKSSHCPRVRAANCIANESSRINNRAAPGREV